MKRLITFATSEYRKQAERLVKSARPFFDELVLHTPKDLDAEFYARRDNLFRYRRGFGYWCWKSYLIGKHLERMDPDDSLMYADSSVVIERDCEPLFAAARQHNGIGLFHQKREKHKNSRFTRGDCFRLMGCDESKYWQGDNLATTFSVWNRTAQSLAFVREWHEWNCNYAVVSDEPSQTPNAPDFKDHRHDQSIASLLAIKHALFTLCDPSQFGDGYRCEHCSYPRILQVDRTVQASWPDRPTMQSILEVGTTATCALRCKYCPQDRLVQSYQGANQLTPSVYEKCLDNYSPGDAIYFAGFVEPCLNKQFVLLLLMTLERGHRTRLYTTGRGLNVAQAEAIAKLNIDQIVLHLPDRFGSLSFSENNVPVMEALSRGRNVECMTMDNVPHPSLEGIWQRLPKNMGAMHDRAGNVVGTQAYVAVRKSGPIRCRVAPSLDHSVLLPDGRLSLCCMDYSLMHVIGDLSTTPYTTILRDEPIQEIRRRQQNERVGDVLCRACVCSENIAN